VPRRLLAFCLLPNHGHLAWWPRQDGDLSRFLHWLTMTHTQRWHGQHHTTGTGPLYQGRFQSLPIQEDEHLLAVCRYVERNPLRAQLVRLAEPWRWSSLWHRVHGTGAWLLAAGPVTLPEEWLAYVHRVETAAELEAVRRSVVRCAPFGEETWQEATAQKLG
jgi:putative transposase